MNGLRVGACVPAVLLSVLAVTSATSAAAVTVDREFQESFEVEVGDRLVLSFGDGDVEITPWEKDTLDVNVRYYAEHRRIGISSGGDPDFTVDFGRTGDTIRVTGREVGRRIFGFGIFTSNRHEYRYTVRAPRYLVLDLQGEDGDVNIRGWGASVDLSSEDGDLYLADSEGELRARTEDGDSVIESHTGGIDLRSEDGDISIRGCAAAVVVEVEDGDVDLERCQGSVDVIAEDGDIYLDEVDATRVGVRTEDGDAILGLSSAGALELDVRTGDGDVSVELGPEVSARFSIDTDDGTIRVDAPGVDVSRGRSHAAGAFGDGNGSIRIRAADGHVHLRLRQP